MSLNALWMVSMGGVSWGLVPLSKVRVLVLVVIYILNEKLGGMGSRDSC